MKLEKVLKEGIVFFDGAMGSELQKRGVLGCPELVNVEKPEILKEIHRSYLEAGSNFISANTFGGNRYKLSKYGLEARLEELVQGGIKVAREAVSSIGKSDRYVALDLGPTGKLLKPYGDTSFDEIYEVYKEIALISHGADIVILETFSQLGELRAAYLAFKENTSLPIICSMTFEENGRTLTGTDPAAFAATMEAMGAAAVGVNCSLGPDGLVGIVKKISQHVSIPIIAMPNAGLPRLIAGKTVYGMKADVFANEIEKLVTAGANILGGCCGTTPEFISEMKKKKTDYERLLKSVVKLAKKPLVVCSSRKIHYLENEITMVGERINPTGRKALSEAFKQGDFSIGYKDAISQTEAGANLLDVNVAVPGTDECESMRNMVINLESLVETPLQLDSSNPAVLEAGLRVYNGIAMVNSVNAKDENLEVVLPLVKKYGACVLGLTMGKEIPKDGPGRFELAKKIIHHAEKMGIEKERVFIDCLSMAASATQEYTAETLYTLSLCQEAGYHTALGVSNVSFGLPERKIMNSAFLAMALGRNLDLAIINPLEERMVEAVLSARVVMNYDKGCVEYINYASKKSGAGTGGMTTATSAVDKELTLRMAIIRGLKEDALICLNQVIEKEGPLGVVDDYIIPALKEVGDNFEKGKIYLPQLLQSAETVKLLFEKIKTLVDIKSGKGTVVLCTVQGDIHDIGKNIVKVMLQNNGYDVVDLGCDVAPEKVTEAVRKTGTKLVGLSALMTTTIPGMEATITALEGMDVKTVVGGAVLSKETADRIGASYYAKDAVETVRIADEIIG